MSLERGETFSSIVLHDDPALAFRLLVTRLNGLRHKWIDQSNEMRGPNRMGEAAGIAHCAEDLWQALTTPLLED